MSEFNPYAAPTADTGVAPPATGSGEGLWRSGRFLVVEKGVALPDVCVACNAPANGYTLRRRLSWHSGWWYLALIVNLFVYLVAALIVRKTASIHVGLCTAHRRWRRTWLVTAWSLAAAAVALPFALGWLSPDAAPYGIGLLPLLLLAAALVGLYGGRVVYAKRIDEHFTWVGGVSPAFLVTLPEWRGASS